MKNNKKLDSFLGHAAWFGDYAVAAIVAPWVAGRRVREDIMDVKNITKWVPVFKTYKKHFVEHVKKHNNDRLSGRAFVRYVTRRNVYPTSEIERKKLGDIVEKIKTADWISVVFFEETEHQRRMPQFCRVGDYTINFASDGTIWCGGIRGKGYISITDVHGINRPIATISPELSDYLAKTIMQKRK